MLAAVGSVPELVMYKDVLQCSRSRGLEDNILSYTMLCV